MSYQVEDSAGGCGTKGAAGIRPLFIRDLEGVLLTWIAFRRVVLSTCICISLRLAGEELAPLRLRSLERVFFVSCLSRIEVVLFQSNGRVMQFALVRSDVCGLSYLSIISGRRRGCIRFLIHFFTKHQAGGKGKASAKQHEK